MTASRGDGHAPRVLAVEIPDDAQAQLRRPLWLAGLPLTIASDAATAQALLAAGGFALLLRPPSCPIRAAIPELIIGAELDPQAPAQAILERVLAALEVPAEVRFTESEDGWFEVETGSHRASVDRFQTWCDYLVQGALDRDGRHALLIAIRELGQNAIEWGHGFEAQRRLRLGYRLGEELIEVRIADEGPGFDLAELPDLADPLAIVEDRPRRGKRAGGFGVHLAREATDRLDYNARGNEVTIAKRFTRSPT